MANYRCKKFSPRTYKA